MNACAGIVLYNPNIDRLMRNIKSIQDQVDHIYVVDNGSENFGDIYNSINTCLNISVIRNMENMGIAKALNQMCQVALETGYDWILTLDQDSVCPAHMIEIFMSYTDITNIGIICPAVNYEGWKNKSKFEKPIEEIGACMTSASFTNLHAWKYIGGFCENYFIDYVDNEFCMKLRIHNYKILRVNRCIFSHQLGDSGHIKLFGIISVNYTRHSPLRLYYMTRNNLFFIRKYSNELNIVKEYLKLIYVVTSGFFASNKKISSLKYIMRGIYDFKNNRMGKYQKSN